MKDVSTIFELLVRSKHFQEIKLNSKQNQETESKKIFEP